MGLHFWGVSEAKNAVSRAESVAGTDAHRAEADVEEVVKEAKTSETLGFAIGLMTWVLGASVFVAVKAVQDEMPPFSMASARVAITALVMTLFIYPHLKAISRFLRHHWLHVLFIGAVGLGINQGLIFTALHKTTAVNVGIVFALAPIFTLVLARVILHESMNGLQWLGAAVAFCGVLIVTVQGDPARLLTMQINAGEYYALGGSVLFAIYTVMLKQAKFDLPRIPLLTILLYGGVIGTAPFVYIEHLNGDHDNLGRNGYLALLYCSVVGGALLYLFFNWSIEILGAGRAGTLLYTEPLFVAIFAWIILGEQIEWYHYLGGAIVALGVVLVLTMRPKARA